MEKPDLSNSPDALVVLSGGQDSTTALYWAKQHFRRVHAVTFHYGQSHSREIDCARAIALDAGVPLEIVDLGPILKSTSPLVDFGARLEEYTDHASMVAAVGDRIEATFVPMRNALFLTVAANRAVAVGMRNLVTGVCQQDSANYPDCRRSFIDAQVATINAALGIDDFRIHTPLIDVSKADAIRWASDKPEVMAALGKSHTCYAGQFPPCGKCHACVLRAHSFAEAGVADPLIERARA